MKSVSVEDEIYDKLSSHVESDARFSTVDEYVNYVLSQVVQKLEKAEDYSEEDEKIIKEKLKGLGYMD